MDHFEHRNGALWCEGVAVADLARKHGTPLYVYSATTLKEHVKKVRAAFATPRAAVRFSVKSCSNVHILASLSEAGAGMDVVSGGELYRALRAGVAPEQIVFAGVGKSAEEIREAIAARVGFLNVESEEELDLVARIANELGARQRVAIRVNPDVADARTPAQTSTGHGASKFGVELERAAALYLHYADHGHVAVTGIHFHLGSPIYSEEPYLRALRKVLALEERLRARGVVLDAINVGGGYLAHYGDPRLERTRWDVYSSHMAPLLGPFVERGGQVLVEPGRSVAANAGILVSEVLYTKETGGHRFVILDAGMSHYMRPALYGAEQFMWPVEPPAGQVPERRVLRPELEGLRNYDVVGPICESTDRLAKDRPLPPMSSGALFAIFGAGAYGMSMASQYNSRPRPAEILVEGDTARVIRRRETYDDLLAAEADASPLPTLL